MKNVALFILLGFFSILSSCGGSSDENSETAKTETGTFSASDDLVKADLPEGWTVDGKGPNEFSIYSYLLDEGSDIYKEIKHDYGFPSIDEVKQVSVDGLPALTLKEKFKQNKEMIGRTWLIYNGRKIINVTVQSPEGNWDDAVAERVISSVKITDREANVELPKAVEEEQYIKPDEFPTETLALFDEYYSETPNLSIEILESANKVNELLQSQTDKELTDEAKLSIMQSIMLENGFENTDEYLRAITITSTSFSLLSSCVKINKLDLNSQEYKITFGILKSIIVQTKISKADLQFVYDNWDIAKEFAKKIDK